MYTFEEYILAEQDVALRSNFSNILNVIEREDITDPNLFFNRVHTLVNRMPATNASKAKIIQHLKISQNNNGIDGMKEYLKKAAGFYEKGGFVSKAAAKADAPIYYDQGWNKPPTPEKLAMHFGDVVKYVGPSHAELNPNDDYMIVRREEHNNKVTFFVKLYDSKTGKVRDPRELEKRIENPNYLKKIGNNLEDMKKAYVRVGQSHIEDAQRKQKAAEEHLRSLSKTDLNKFTRVTR
jgi:hypothetical protein